jgi:hypothetical protein
MEQPTPASLTGPELLAVLKVRAHTESVLRDGDPHYDIDNGEASAWDKTVTPDVVLSLVYELERLRREAVESAKKHQWTSVIQRPDGLVITATIALPDGHNMIAPAPRPWNLEGDWPLSEMSELAFMCAQSSHRIIDRNFQTRLRYRQQDHWWAKDQEVPTPAIEAALPVGSPEAEHAAAVKAFGPGHPDHPDHEHEDCCK